MNDTVTATLVGDAIETPTDVKPPKTREQRVADWRTEHRAAYDAAYESVCNCAPTRAELLTVEQFRSPPID